MFLLRSKKEIFPLPRNNCILRRDSRKLICRGVARHNMFSACQQKCRFEQPDLEILFSHVDNALVLSISLSGFVTGSGTPDKVTRLEESFSKKLVTFFLYLRR